MTKTPSSDQDDPHAVREAETASHRATAEARDYVLGQAAYLSSEVHYLLGGGADSQNRNEMAKRLRQGRQLLGI